MSQKFELRFAFPLLFAVGIGCYFVFPTYLSLLSIIFVVSIFALSYDLLQGYGGVVSLGHAAYFGIGAYAAAISANYGIVDPLVGLVIAFIVSGLAAGVLARIVVIGNDLTRLLVTLGVGFLFHELANQMRWLTGGADGLSGFTIGPLFGMFKFDFWGRTAFIYAFGVLVVTYLVVWRISTSPLGLALRGIRENPRRMPSIGAPVQRHLALTYTLSGAIAGVAGAVLAQTSKVASLGMLGFERSAEVVIMTAIGGTGSIPGVIVGAAAFTWLKDILSAVSPKYWHLGIGVALMLSVFLLPRGFAGLATSISRRMRGRK